MIVPLYRKEKFMKNKLKENTRNNLRTQIVNSIATRIAYKERLNKEKEFRSIGDFIILSVPILIYGSYQLPKYIDCVAEYSWVLDLLSLIIGVGITIFGLYRSIFKPDANIENLSNGISNNILEEHETKFVLESGDETIALWFLKMTSSVKIMDTKNLLDLSEEEKQYGYREALIEFNEGNCPYCSCNPLKLNKTNVNKCSKCGNSPVEE